MINLREILVALLILSIAEDVLGLSSPLAAYLGVLLCLSRARRLKPHRARSCIPSPFEQPFGEDKVLIFFAMPRGQFVIYGVRARIVSS